MSYTNFDYSELKLSSKTVGTKDTVIVSYKIKNTGSREGHEVVQLYIRDMLSSVTRPVMELKGFQRIYLKAGETKAGTFIITPEMLSMLNEKLERVIEPGEFKIMIGASSTDIRLREILGVK